MQYPIEFRKLEKGQLLSCEEIEMATGRKRSDIEGFRLAALSLRERIHQETRLVCKVTEQGIYIMTDAEAATHTANRFEINRRGMTRQHVLGQRVDAATLSSEARARHERAQLRQAGILAVMRGAAKTAVAAATQGARVGPDRDQADNLIP